METATQQDRRQHCREHRRQTVFKRRHQKRQWRALEGRADLCKGQALLAQLVGGHLLGLGSRAGLITEMGQGVRPSRLLRNEQQQGQQQWKKGFAQGHDGAILTYLAACQTCCPAMTAKTGDKFGNVQSRASVPKDNAPGTKPKLPTAAFGTHSTAFDMPHVVDCLCRNPKPRRQNFGVH